MMTIMGLLREHKILIIRIKILSEKIPLHLQGSSYRKEGGPWACGTVIVTLPISYLNKSSQYLPIFSFNN